MSNPSNIPIPQLYHDFTEASTRDTNYEMFVLSNFKARTVGIDGFLHAALGIASEAGELLDAVKKTWVYEKPLDGVNLLEELGDLEWYMAAMRCKAGWSRQQVLEYNEAKLRLRYPNQYTNEAAIARADKAPVQLAPLADPAWEAAMKAFGRKQDS